MGSLLAGDNATAPAPYEDVYKRQGKTMTDVIAGVDVKLPTVMTMEPYQYFIYQQ